MAPTVIVIDGKKYVVVPKQDFDRLKAGTDVPDLPKPNRKGLRPALETIDALIAQDIVKQRKDAGMTQQELAEMAGIRVETFSRIESGKNLPSIPTIQKIQKVLTRKVGRHPVMTAQKRVLRSSTPRRAAKASVRTASLRNKRGRRKNPAKR